MEDLSAAKLDQIREILVGDQARENERRITSLEERFTRELTMLGQRIKDMDQSMRDRCAELASLQDRLSDQSLNREELSGILSEIARRLDKDRGASNE